ncbi:MAG: S53 family peptidase [Candidatus Sulfotelmatobacter sp.]
MLRSIVRTASFLMLPLILGASLNSASAQTWAPTATQGITLSNMPSATDAGPLNPQTNISVVVGLKTQNVSALQQLVRAENTPGGPLYQTTITPQQFLTSYAPTSSQVQAVTNYLQNSGFTNITVEPNNLLIEANGTAAAAASAFNTSFEQYILKGSLVYANTQPAQVPESLSGTVLAVLGLNTVARMTTPLTVRTAGDCAESVCLLNSEAPQGFWQAYDVGSTPTGSKATIAIFIFGSSVGIENDLHVAEQANGLPQVPVQIQQIGITNPSDLGGGEWQLDSQFSTGMAGTVKKLYIYDVTDPIDADIAQGFNHFVTDNLARAGSASFGECEYGPYLDGAAAIIDGVLLEGAAQGQSVFASTGDTGAACSVLPYDTNGDPDSGLPMVSYPASSIYVTGVGGTSLFLDSSGDYSEEIAWAAGGGGIAQFSYCGYWQQNADVLSCEDGDKGVPDIAMDADPYETAATIYYACGSSGPSACEESGVGGTSLSSPLSLGVWARLLSASNNKLGYAPPNLYSFYQPGDYGVGSTDPGFHDITVGNNGLYSAGPGWDFTTGLGSFDVSAINALLNPPKTK